MKKENFAKYTAEKQALNLINSTDNSDIFSEKQHPKYIIALDEVGRGCLAGPVFAAASIWTLDSNCILKNTSSNTLLWENLVKDSKKMSSLQRDKCFNLISNSFAKLAKYTPVFTNNLGNKDLIKPHFKSVQFAEPKTKIRSLEKFNCLNIEVGTATEEEIDSINIWNAVQLAMGRAMLSLISSFNLDKVVNNSIIVVDGKQSIKVPPIFAKTLQVTCIKGDDIFLSVGTSSVVAKVLRDKFMQQIAPQFAGYDLDNNKGYGTAKHITAIKEKGILPIHRKSFLTKIT